MVAYLEEVAGADGATPPALPDGARERYPGTYVVEEGRGGSCPVETNRRGVLGLRIGRMPAVPWSTWEVTLSTRQGRRPCGCGSNRWTER